MVDWLNHQPVLDDVLSGFCQHASYIYIYQHDITTGIIIVIVIFIVIIITIMITTYYDIFLLHIMIYFPTIIITIIYDTTIITTYYDIMIYILSLSLLKSVVSCYILFYHYYILWYILWYIFITIVISYCVLVIIVISLLPVFSQQLVAGDSCAAALAGQQPMAAASRGRRPRAILRGGWKAAGAPDAIPAQPDDFQVGMPTLR